MRTGLFRSAEWRMGFHASGFAIYLDHSGFRRLDEMEGAADIFGEDGGAEPEGDAVGNFESLL